MTHAFESLYDQLANSLPAGTPEDEVLAVIRDFDAALRAATGGAFDGPPSARAMAAAHDLLDDVVADLALSGDAPRKSPEHREQLP